ncbi:MAG: hypothetical protein ALECFALPRED_010363 [Alectoria fallacina]|uniref:Dephospho-CoA kinase n=1 Tax=Alectoria fallacina TaxID=1903189 RepID=A0A8H3PK81_9LECA|nr:MAG: hypothetical protein ALECFALPRED_010363 [Alectoria fallacina]
MILIGLTGSLATGKSTVSNLLRSPPYALPIIDADLLAHRAVQPGTYGYRQILAKFGPTTPDLLQPLDPTVPLGGGGGGVGTNAERHIDRAALGRRVFGDGEAKRRDRNALNGIVHPLVRLAMARELLYHFVRGRWAVVLDIPLLYESALDVLVSVVLMVAVSSPSVQMRRLRRRDPALSAAEAQDRVGSQMGVEEKVARTRARDACRGKVLLNDGGRGDLEREVARAMGEVRAEAGGPLWGWWLLGSPVGAAGAGAWEVYLGWRARRRWEEERRRERTRL